MSISPFKHVISYSFLVAFSLPQTIKQMADN
jgi:hypothetical protein